MSGDPYDPATFEITYPLYLVVQQSDGGPRVMVSQTKRGEPFVPVFTDDDLAARFVASRPAEKLAAVAVPTPEAFGAHLAAFAAAGLTHVGFDCGRFVTRVPIGRVLPPGDS